MCEENAWAEAGFRIGRCVKLAVISSVSGLLKRLVNELKVQWRGDNLTYKCIYISINPKPVLLLSVSQEVLWHTDLLALVFVTCELEG